MVDLHNGTWHETLTAAFNTIENLPGAPFVYGDTIIYYDGPRVYWLHTHDSRALLVEAADETADDYIELAVTLDLLDLEGYLRGDSPFREAWTNAKADDLHLIHHPADDNIKTWVEHPPYPIPEDLLPAPEVRLG